MSQEAIEEGSSIQLTLLRAEAIEEGSSMDQEATQLTLSFRIQGSYPPDWPDIAFSIKDAAGWQCEHCGHAHEPASGHTLTVHHLDGDPANCADENLVALCQKCHLHIQASYIPGQLLLPGVEAPAWMEARRLGWIRYGGDPEVI